MAVASSNLYLKLIRHEGVKYVVNFKLKDSNLLSHCLVEADFPLAPAMLVFQGQCSDGSSVDMAGVAAFEILASRNEWKTFQRLEIPYKSEQKEYTFDFVPFYAYAFNISGSLKERSASIHLDVSTKHRLKEGAIYVLALIPVDKTVVVYALNSQNSWTQVKDADAVPARFKGKLPNTLDAKILDKSDITALVGTKVVVGYGLGSSSFKEMIDTKRSLLVYTLAP